MIINTYTIKNSINLLKLERNLITNSFWINKFINQVTKKGYKMRIEGHILQVFGLIGISSSIWGLNTIFLFLRLIYCLKPVLILIKKKKSKLLFNIPIPIKGVRGYKLAVRWVANWVKLDLFSNNIITSLYNRLNDLVFYMQEANLFFDYKYLSLENEVEIPLTILDVKHPFNVRNELYQAAVFDREYMHYRWI